MFGCDSLAQRPRAKLILRQARISRKLERVLILSLEKPRLKSNLHPSPATAKGNVAQRHCSHPRKFQLLSSGVCDDAEHQPQDSPGLGTRSRELGDAALKLLTIAKKHPEALLKA